MLTRFRSAALIALMVAAPAIAHHTLPAYTWCSPGRVVQVAHFFFAPPQIQQFANCQSAAACVMTDPSDPGTDIGLATGRPARLAGRGAQPPVDCSQMLTPEPTDSCGIFDDDYALARRMTDAFCARYTVLSTAAHVADWGTVVPHVSSPGEIFYDPDPQHHNYQIGGGIDAICARCEDPSGVPTN